MTLVVTEAIVLHAFDYLESSRILKLVTRDAGVRSVLARGAKRSRRRFGAALDLYANGNQDTEAPCGEVRHRYNTTRSVLLEPAQASGYSGGRHRQPFCNVLVRRSTVRPEDFDDPLVKRFKDRGRMRFARPNLHDVVCAPIPSMERCVALDHPDI